MSSQGKNVLFITTVLPHNRTTGGEIVSAKFIDSITELGHSIIVLGYLRESDRFPKMDNCHIIEERRIESNNAKVLSILWGVRSLIKSTPYSVEKYYSGKCLSDLKHYIDKYNIEILIIDHTQMSWVLKFIGTEKIKIVSLLHNIESQLYTDLANSDDDYFKSMVYRRESRLIKKYENLICEKSKQIWCVSSGDVNQLSKRNPNVYLFDIPVSSAGKCPEMEKQYEVGLLGTWSWSANKEGLTWFVKEVVPKIKGNTSIAIAGRGAEWLREIPEINYLGYVQNSQEFLCKCKVMAIPSVAGGGIQIKTIEAISSGHPVVATSVALRGIEELPSSVYVADSPDLFAMKLLQAVDNFSQISFHPEAEKWAEKREEKFINQLEARLLQ